MPLSTKKRRLCVVAQPTHVLMKPEVSQGTERRREVGCTLGWDVSVLWASLLNYTFNELNLWKTIKLHEIRARQKMQVKGHHFKSTRHLYQWCYQDGFGGTNLNQLYTKLYKKYQADTTFAQPLLSQGSLAFFWSFSYLSFSPLAGCQRCLLKC